MRPISKLLQAASVAVVTVAALSLSATPAEAKGGHGHRHGHGHKHHGCAVRTHAHYAPVVYQPVYRPVYAPVYAPVVVARPMIPRPVVVVPAYPVAPVVYDRHRDGVDGFIGISGPHVSIGIGF